MGKTLSSHCNCTTVHISVKSWNAVNQAKYIGIWCTWQKHIAPQSKMYNNTMLVTKIHCSTMRSQKMHCNVLVALCFNPVQSKIHHNALHFTLQHNVFHKNASQRFGCIVLQLGTIQNTSQYIEPTEMRCTATCLLVGVEGHSICPVCKWQKFQLRKSVGS